MNIRNFKQFKRELRQRRVRAVISGTSERPRLNVYRSLTGVFAQLIDDVNSKTLVSVHSKKVVVKDAKVGERKSKTALAYALGKELSVKAKEKNITNVVFDRGGFRFHGRVKAVADGARDGGLIF